MAKTADTPEIQPTTEPSTEILALIKERGQDLLPEDLQRETALCMTAVINFNTVKDFVPLETKADGWIAHTITILTENSDYEGDLIELVSAQLRTNANELCRTPF
ncbi:MAG: hypothetical protein K9M03_01185 [Kiritimatiellales bacterium]|nr:hypothetical protein [Kiritimatiellales bacterium]